MPRHKSGETPRTEHRGYPIFYNENSDTWTVSDLGLDSPKLSTLKGKIDRFIKRHNDDHGVPVLHVTYHDHPVEALVIGVSEKMERDWEGWKNGAAEKMKRTVILEWVGNRTGNSERASRQKSPLSEFVADTPEIREMFREADRLDSAAKQAAKKHSAYIAAIPRCDESLFANLKPDPESEV